MLREKLRKLSGPLDGFLETPIADDDIGQRSGRRIGHDAAVMEFAFEEGGIILLDRVLDGVVPGIERLDEDAAGQIATAGTAGDLRKKLKSAFGGPEVRHVEGAVGAYNADQRDPMKIVPFGEHL